MMNAWKTLKTFNSHLIAKTLITLLSQVRVRDDISQKSITLPHSLYVQSQGLVIHWFLFVLFVIFVLTVSCFIIDQTACFCHWIYFSFFHVQPFIGDYLIWVQLIAEGHMMNYMFHHHFVSGRKLSLQSYHIFIFI